MLPSSLCLADDCSEYSVTILSVVRLTCLTTETRQEHDRTGVGWFFRFGWNYVLMTSVEANFSIICGQYMTASSAGSYECRLYPGSSFHHQRVSLPSDPYYRSSLRSSNYYASARVLINEGSKLLISMLPGSKSAPEPVTPSSRR